MRSFTRASMIITGMTIMVLPATTAIAAATQHVVMISIDGLRPEIYLEPERVGVQVPHLVELRRQGVSAKRMIPIFPSVTYPAHTTLVTGVYPAAHGVVNNFKKGTEWYLQAGDIRAKTLWQAAREKGLTTAIVTWPASYGAEVNYLIPENLSLNVTNVPHLIRAGATPGLFERLEQKFGPVQIPSFEHADAGELLDRMTGQFAAEVLREYNPHLLLLHFLDADHQQHLNGPQSAEANHAFELIDRAIGELRRAAQDAGLLDSTTFVIVGDHGFVPVHTSINVNALLASLGYGLFAEDGSFSARDVVATPIGGAAFFSLSSANKPSLAAKVTTAFRREIQKRYMGLIEFVAREDLDRFGAFPGALFALTTTEGYMFTAAPVPQPLVPAGSFKGMHGYLPSMPSMATGFIMSGAGVRKGLQLPLVRMIDVAPTVATLLGVDLETATGFSLPGVFETPDPGYGLGPGIKLRE